MGPFAVGVGMEMALGAISVSASIVNSQRTVMLALALPVNMGLARVLSTSRPKWFWP